MHKKTQFNNILILFVQNYSNNTESGKKWIVEFYVYKQDSIRAKLLEICFSVYQT